MARRLVILGWDSATFDIVDPMIDSGRLPALAELSGSGFRASLRSTWPPMTDCAWTSAFTGRNPAAHGIFGSWYRAPGAYACRYFSSRDRKAPTVWEIAMDVRTLTWNVPMSYPPVPMEGVMVAGYGAPPGSRFTSPHEVQDELARRWDINDLLDRAPHGSLETFRTHLIQGLEAQAEAIVWVAQNYDIDHVIAVWPQIDRAQHFFWQFRGTDHPFATTIEEVYEATDRATARVVEACPDADILVVSDHGAGPLKGDVNLGAWLARNGYAEFGAPRPPIWRSAPWAIPPALRKLGKRLAPGLARKALGAALTDQLGAFNWSRTKAFTGVHSDVWFNIRHREPDGFLSAEEASDLATELTGKLRGLSDPRTGELVFAETYEKSEIYSGSVVDLAPDLMVDSWSNGYRMSPRPVDSDEIVTAPTALPGVTEAWSSNHFPLGIFVAAGPRIARGSAEELRIYDLCPTALALLEQTLPGGLDGDLATAAIDPAWLAQHPPAVGGELPERTAEGGLLDDEAEAVAAHLRDLGYIE